MSASASEPMAQIPRERPGQRGTAMAGGYEEKSAHGAREIIIGHMNSHDQTPNRVSTTKYTLLTFIPSVAASFFSSHVNVAYLGVALIQLVPGASPSFKYDTAILIAIAFAWEAAMALIAELGRRAADSKINCMRVVRLNNQLGTFESCLREDLGLGDIIKLVPGDVAPADMIIVHIQPSAPDPALQTVDVALNEPFQAKHDKACTQNQLKSSLQYVQSCLVSTAQLDGESAPKHRVAVMHLAATDAASVSSTLCTLCVRCGPPTYAFDDFSGVLINSCCAGEVKAIGTESIVHAGSVLEAGADHVLGAAVYVGLETAAMHTTKERTTKHAHTDAVLDSSFIRLAGVLSFVAVCLSLVSATLAATRERNLGVEGYGAPVIFVYLLSLLVCVPNTYIFARDMARGFLARAISHDKQMQCPHSAKGIVSAGKQAHPAAVNPQFRAVARAYGLVESLGDVRHLLTDKTGTLTRNEMILRVLVDAHGRTIDLPETCVAGGAPADNSTSDFTLARCFDAISPILRISTPDSNASIETMPMAQNENTKVDLPPSTFDELLIAMSLCHTVSLSSAYDSKSSASEKVTEQYIGESPDETAIVAGAARLGHRLDDRSKWSMTVKCADGKSRTFEVLAVLPFDSRRMRMSVVIKYRDSIRIYTKGAERSIWSCTNAGGVYSSDTESSGNSNSLNANHPIKETVESLSHNGLRVLVFASRSVTKKEWKAWLSTWMDAQTNGHGTDKRDAMDNAIAAIEHNMSVLGATGVEDSLQDGVPECLSALRSAGIRIWMVTGDTIGTSVTVARNCGLAGPHTMVHEVFDSKDSTLAVDHQDETEVLEAPVSRNSLPENRIVTLCGTSACSILEKRPEAILCLVKRSTAAIIYRCSPAQKAEIARLIMRATGSTCLAIGDGANDVEMLRTASVGVGLAGREGTFAHAAGDFALANFAHLQRLLLVHGAQARARVFRGMCFFIYKSVAFGTTSVAFQVASLFSGAIVADTAMFAGHNIPYTIGAFLVVAVLDAPFGPPSDLMKHPARYFRMPGGQRDIYQAALSGFLTACAVVGTAMAIGIMDDEPLSMTAFSHICYAALLVSIITRACVLVRNWSKRIAILVGLGMMIWMCEVMLVEILAKTLSFLGSTALLGVPGVLHFALQPRVLLVAGAVSFCAILFEILSAFVTSGLHSRSRNFHNPI